MCLFLGVCRAAYYKWLNRKPSDKQLSDEALAEKIKILYHEQNGILGYRQMTIAINRRYGLHCNAKRVYRLMRILELRSVCRRKRRYRNKKILAECTAENILNRKFTSNCQNEKWLTDVTEFKYANGKKAYLSAVLDLYGRNIAGFSFGHSNNNDLVFATFEHALTLHPNATPLLHSDRGYQYTSRTFQKKMEQAGIIQSMSRAGYCIDNGPMEGFWGFLKTEMYYLFQFETYEALKAAVCEYIDFYNNRRYQKKLGCMTPNEFIQQSAINT